MSTFYIKNTHIYMDDIPEGGLYRSKNCSRNCYNYFNIIRDD